MEVDSTDNVPTEGKRNFEIKKLMPVTCWSWDTQVDNCAICRGHVMEPCVTCAQPESGTPTTECTVAWGVCSHGFHYHCIDRWLESHNTCPMDAQPWEYAKYGH